MQRLNGLVLVMLLATAGFAQSNAGNGKSMNSAPQAGQNTVIEWGIPVQINKDGSKTALMNQVQGQPESADTLSPNSPQAMAEHVATTRSASAAPKGWPKDETVNPPSVLVITFHSGDCQPCGRLEANLASASREFANSPALFTQFDLSDDFGRSQAAQFAALLGIQEAYRQNVHLTGFALVVDSATKRVLGRITADQSSQQITAALRQILQSYTN